MGFSLFALGGFAVFVGILFLIAMSLRRVVATNEVHIVQSAGKTTSYGKDTQNGNTYYEWPSSLPVLGVTKIVLPVSVFDLDLANYEAYDKGRLPFVVDVKAFFRITDSNLAAARVSSFKELHNQLQAVVQGAVRSILASNEIEEIMQGRSKFGNEFTNEVDTQLKEWGVATVKSIELMDIRDHKDSNVIKNIMEKKKSHIEMESRLEVAKNMKLAQVAEIEAQREVDLNEQEAAQQVGLRTVEAQQKVAMAEETKKQNVIEQSKLTAEREMEVTRVKSTKAAEINREVAIVEANKQKEVSLVEANRLKEVALLEANKQKEVAKLLAEKEKESGVIKAEADYQVQTKIADAEYQVTTKKAEADLISKQNSAKGIQAEGLAKAEAEKALLLAPVEAQISLAKEIGENKEYQNYLLEIERIKAGQAVGEAQAEALANADVKVISNTGSPTEGIKSIGELFTSGGGMKLGAMMEGLANTEMGKAVLDKALGPQ